MILRTPGVLLMGVTNAVLIAIQTGTLVFLFPLYLFKRAGVGAETVGFLVSLSVFGRLVALWLGGTPLGSVGPPARSDARPAHLCCVACEHVIPDGSHGLQRLELRDWRRRWLCGARPDGSHERSSSAPTTRRRNRVASNDH